MPKLREMARALASGQSPSTPTTKPEKPASTPKGIAGLGSAHTPNPEPTAKTVFHGEPKRAMAPAVLSPKERADLLESLAKGRSLEISALHTGHSTETVLRMADRDPDLREEMKKARGNGLSHLLGRIEEGKTWQNSAWLLERMHPELFALRDSLRAQTNVQVNVTVSRDQCADVAKAFANWMTAKPVTPVSQDNVNH